MSIKKVETQPQDCGEQFCDVNAAMQPPIPSPLPQDQRAVPHARRTGRRFSTVQLLIVGACVLIVCLLFIGFLA